MGKQIELGRSWKYLTRRRREHLRFCTIIIGAIRVTEVEAADKVRSLDVIEQAVEMIDAFLAQWVSLGKSRQMVGYTHRGGFEIDLKRDLPGGSHCHETLASMGCNVSPLGPNERILVVHVHLVLDATGVADHDDLDGERWADQVRHVWKTKWPGIRRTQVKGLRARQTVPVAIRKIHSYCHKREYKYSMGGYGDEPTVYGASYEWIWMRLLVKIYKTAGTEFRSKK